MQKHIYTILLALTCTLALAQPKSIERVVGVVGDNIVMQSEVEAQYYQMISQGYEMESNSKCAILEEFLYQKLLLNQAKLDSVEVSQDQVEEELDRRIRYFSAQIGGQDKLEDYYGKSILQIKDDFRELIENQLLVQTMQQKITADVKVTPAEVFDYYNRIPKDSLPFINAEVEIGRIVKNSVISDAAKKTAKDKAIDLRARAVDGTDFCILSIHSDDPGSAPQCGDLGYFERGTMVPEFDAVAFRLKEKGEISEVFETKFGYHFMKLTDRKGEKVRASHILIKPKTTRADLNAAKAFLDTVYDQLQSDTLTFTKAVEKYSDEEDAKGSEGLIMNPNTGTTKFEMDEISQVDPTIFLTIDKMQPGEISKPTLTANPDGEETYSIIYLKSRTEPHVANLKDDYQRIQNAATMEKQAKNINNWMREKLEDTYVKINPDFQDCIFEHNWTKSAQ